MDGWWDCDAVDQFFDRLFRSQVDEHVILNLPAWFLRLVSLVSNRQSLERATHINRHYNHDASVFMSFLDPYNQYSCGYFKGTNDLDRAQEQKLELICRKLDIRPEDRVLDVGCGWGGFAKYAAQHYGCQVTGITISQAQLNHAEEYCKGLPVTLLKLDYRDLKGEFDKIVVCGMMEHVGYRNYRRFFKVLSGSLRPHGLLLVQTIGSLVTQTHCDPWFDKYIFPNGLAPSLKQVTTAAERTLVVEDIHNMGSYYDKTLIAWMERFNENLGHYRETNGERAYRMWKYYFLSMAGAFRSRRMQLWQVVFSRTGVYGGYASVR